MLEVKTFEFRGDIEAKHLFIISQLLIFVSNSINFLVYCFVGKTFRNELRKLFCRNQVAAVPNQVAAVANQVAAVPNQVAAVPADT